ncbi:MAG: hypothetical protein ABIZ34_02765 [Candidatus Limnocylindrales bacterium]
MTAEPRKPRGRVGGLGPMRPTIPASKRMPRAKRSGPANGPATEGDTEPTTLDPSAYVPVRPARLARPVAVFRLGPADRALVVRGAEIAVGDPLLERARSVTQAHVHVGSRGALEPGEMVEPSLLPVARTARRRFRANERAMVLYVGPDGEAHLALRRSPETVTSVIDGTVESVDGSGVTVRAAGDAIPAAVAWGQPVRGTLLFAVSSPDAELRATAIDVAAAGCIVVAGARVDIEALTRARALGVRGIICGGLIGKELRQLEASEERQRASIHPVAPFGLLLLDGYGRRPIPADWWDELSSSAGQLASIITEPPMVVLEPRPSRAASRGVVRVTAGDHLGREGHLLDLRGLVRMRSGGYLPGGLVELRGRGRSEPSERRVLPLTDLERLD